LSYNQKKDIYLNYHNLGYDFQIGINKIHPSIFRNHIRVIDEILSKDKDMNISITFDDGYEGIYKYAKPLLDKTKIKRKKVFIIGDYIGKNNTWDFSFLFNYYKHLSKNQIRELYQSGWEIGSHGLSHKSFLSMNNSQVKKEVIDSKQILEDIIDAKVQSIAPPFSHINQEVYDLCVEAGYNSIYIQNSVEIQTIEDVNIYSRNNVYSIDRNLNIIKKVKSSKMENKKEKFISSFNNLTVLCSKIIK
tara:strand:- start:813 stop:1553 length:741 start_codon:yes stop_codon:yes gene_type:complete